MSDAQPKGEYVGGYRIRVGENGHSLSIDEATSSEERGDRSLSTKRAKDDIKEVVFPLENLREMPLGISSSFLLEVFSFSPLTDFLLTQLIKKCLNFFSNILFCALVPLKLGAIDCLHIWYFTYDVQCSWLLKWLKKSQVAWHICVPCDTVPIY